MSKPLQVRLGAIVLSSVVAAGPARTVCCPRCKRPVPRPNHIIVGGISRPRSLGREWGPGWMGSTHTRQRAPSHSSDPGVRDPLPFLGKVQPDLESISCRKQVLLVGCATLQVKAESGTSSFKLLRHCGEAREQTLHSSRATPQSRPGGALSALRGRPRDQSALQSVAALMELLFKGAPGARLSHCGLPV